MKNMRYLIVQTFMLTFLITTVISLEGIASYLSGDPITLSWYLPGSVLLVSILCSLPTVLLLPGTSFTKKQWALRKLLHCFFLYLLVMGSGYLFHWYTTKLYFFITSIAFYVIYVLIWIGIRMIGRYEEKLINDALKNIQDEE
ncbi:MAG: DUF3021 family protein [Lachnospiraceae bacterium]|nr:DUF3021 family protein [Lachnospiraceae bacterium]